jgi:uncharacterized protein YrrD
VTRWHLINMPVRIGTAREPFGLVLALWFEWDEGRVDALGVGSRLRRRFLVPFGDGVTIRPDGVHLADRGAMRLARTADWRERTAGDRAGRMLWERGGRALGIVKDVGFNPETGRMVTLWLTRGRLADIVHGMVAVPAAAVGDAGGIRWESTGDAVR